MDIIGNIYKQNCGDYLKVLNKTDKNPLIFHYMNVNFKNIHIKY